MPGLAPSRTRARDFASGLLHPLALAPMLRAFPHVGKESVPADCQQICQRRSSERVGKVFAGLERISLADREQMPDSIGDLRRKRLASKPAEEDLTTQAQRPGPRGRTIATRARWRCWVIAIGRFAPFNALKARRFCSESRFRPTRHPLPSGYGLPAWLGATRRPRWLVNSAFHCRQ